MWVGIRVYQRYRRMPSPLYQRRKKTYKKTLRPMNCVVACNHVSIKDIQIATPIAFCLQRFHNSVGSCTILELFHRDELLHLKTIRISFVPRGINTMLSTEWRPRPIRPFTGDFPVTLIFAIKINKYFPLLKAYQFHRKYF